LHSALRPPESTSEADGDQTSDLEQAAVTATGVVNVSSGRPVPGVARKPFIGRGTRWSLDDRNGQSCDLCHSRSKQLVAGRNGCLNARAMLQANDALSLNSGPILMLKEAVKKAGTRACSELSLSRRSCEQEALGAHCLGPVDDVGRPTSCRKISPLSAPRPVVARLGLFLA